eukprot:TRINITY_DN20206_c0_g1_i1.p1 TRINITY_DN20206_c0_g1~~TRINITY_DN20206_c0_g1_i1.p1  ORF type:complete len:193 (-),score=24.77 TRINITY_DN20206_c0_g1_i1:453-1031(-)
MLLSPVLPLLRLRGNHSLSLVRQGSQLQKKWRSFPGTCFSDSAKTMRTNRTFSSSARTEASSEEQAAKAAAKTLDTAAPTIFDKIIRREIPAAIVFEDEKCLAFKDINPQAPVHLVLIPKQRDGLTQLSKAEERHKEILGHLLYTARVIASQEGLSPDGFRLVINDGPNGCQSVYHLHIHIIGGRQLLWPPG